MRLLLCSPENDRKRRDLREVSEAGQLLQCCLRLGRYANKLPDHQVYDIVGVSLGMNAVEIAVPARSIMVKDEHSFVGERRNELNDEKRIATRLLVHQLWERRSDFRRTANSVRNQLPEMLSAERRKRDLLYSSAGGFDPVALAPH